MFVIWSLSEFNQKLWTKFVEMFSIQFYNPSLNFVYNFQVKALIMNRILEVKGNLITHIFCSWSCFEKICFALLTILKWDMNFCLKYYINCVWAQDGNLTSDSHWESNCHILELPSKYSNVFIGKTKFFVINWIQIVI